MSDEAKLVSRRQVLKGVVGAGGVAGLLFSNRIFASVADACGITPPQTEGPFYPEKVQADEDWDLTVAKGASGKPLGEVIFLEGTVVDELCQPVPKAVVEIWQAAASGRYNHSGDTSGLALDPNFQYFGRAVTDDKGRYRFKTILPGHYPAAENWERPPHIHVKVFARGCHDLTTQLYFEGKSFPDKAQIIDELNRKDAILNAIRPGERQRVIVAFNATATNPIKTGDFQITVQKVKL